MHFKDYLIQENYIATARSILTRAEAEVAKQAADEGGTGFTGDAILKAAKRIANKEAPKHSDKLMKMIANEIERDFKKK